MNERIARLTGFAEAVAARHPDLFDPAVKVAYRIGVGLGDLLVAVEIAKILAEVPPAVLEQADAAIHAWHRAVARCVEPRRESDRRAA